jgi:uncharacterized protein YlxW (UPF0749 family)
MADDETRDAALEQLLTAVLQGRGRMDDSSHAKIDRLDKESRAHENALIRLDGRVERLEKQVGDATSLSAQSESTTWKLALMIGAFGILQAIILAVAINMVNG